jgi:hypothetical protein
VSFTFGVEEQEGKQETIVKQTTSFSEDGGDMFHRYVS